MVDMNWAISLSGVEKTYGRSIKALDGVDIQVGRGEIFGLLGPNGAGKSTLVKIMLTIVRANRLQGTLLGHPIGHQPTLERVGYLPEGHQFPGYLTGEELLDYYGQLSRVPKNLRQARTQQLLDQLGMTKWARTRVEQYSKGMKQRVGLAQALINDPELVILDEPTDGVDPLGRKNIRNILGTLKEQGKTVFINSHILSELEMICDRVAILVKGQVTKQGTIEALTSHSMTYEIVVEGNSEGLSEILDESKASIDGNIITVGSHDAHLANEIIDSLRRHGVMISSVTPKRWSLEDVFLNAASMEG